MANEGGGQANNELDSIRSDQVWFWLTLRECRLTQPAGHSDH
jgi:hypothetical protein